MFRCLWDIIDHLMRQSDDGLGGAVDEGAREVDV